MMKCSKILSVLSALTLLAGSVNSITLPLLRFFRNNPYIG